MREFYGCYLLVSKHEKCKGRTYIGFTVNPRRRIRQHNGQLVNGAWKTSRFRPWDMVLVVYGFVTKVHALQFEWAWQHPAKSKAARGVAQRMGKTAMNGARGKARLLHEMLNVPPWSAYPLQLQLLSSEYAPLLAKCPPLPQHMPVSVAPLEALPEAVGDEADEAEAETEAEAEAEAEAAAAAESSGGAGSDCETQLPSGSGPEFASTARPPPQPACHLPPVALQRGAALPAWRGRARRRPSARCAPARSPPASGTSAPAAPACTRTACCTTSWRRAGARRRACRRRAPAPPARGAGPGWTPLRAAAAWAGGAGDRAGGGGPRAPPPASAAGRAGRLRQPDPGAAARCRPPAACADGGAQPLRLPRGRGPPPRQPPPASGRLRGGAGGPRRPGRGERGCPRRPLLPARRVGGARQLPSLLPLLRAPAAQAPAAGGGRAGAAGALPGRPHTQPLLRRPPPAAPPAPQQPASARRQARLAAPSRCPCGSACSGAAGSRTLTPPPAAARLPLRSPARSGAAAACRQPSSACGSWAAPAAAAASST